MQADWEVEYAQLVWSSQENDCFPLVLVSLYQLGEELSK